MANPVYNTRIQLKTDTSEAWRLNNPILLKGESGYESDTNDELEKAIKKGYLPKDQENEVKIILHNAFNVFLHNPTLNLRNIAQKQESDSIIESIKTIFQSKQNANLLNQYKCEYDFKKDTK